MQDELAVRRVPAPGPAEQLYRNRFKVLKLHLDDCLDAIEVERRAQHYDTQVVLATQPVSYLYGVAAG